MWLGAPGARGGLAAIAELLVAAQPWPRLVSVTLLDGRRAEISEGSAGPGRQDFFGDPF